MFPQRRMTTDTPDGNYEQALNLFVRGEDGWVQMPSRSISLNDYMKQLTGRSQRRTSGARPCAG